MRRTLLALLLGALCITSLSTCLGSDEPTQQEQALLDSLSKVSRKGINSSFGKTSFIKEDGFVRKLIIEWRNQGDSLIVANGDGGSREFQIGHKEGNRYKVTSTNILTGVVTPGVIEVTPTYVEYNNATYYKYIVVPDLEEAPPVPTLKQQEYTVKKGDTYNGIAKKFRVNPDSLQKRNGPLLAGKKIKI